MVKLVAQGVYNEFMMDYMDNNRQKLDAKYPAYEDFDGSFELSEADMQRLVDMASERGVEYDAEEYERSKELMRNQLTAMIAQRLYGVNEFYRWINPRVNDSYVKALTIIENWSEEGDSVLNPKE